MSQVTPGVHERAQTGRLVTVADVARILPRHWDGQRLLRFLAGLALLALAFAAHAGLIAPPGPAAVPLAPAMTSTTVDVPAAPVVDVPAATVDAPAPPVTRPWPVTADGVPAPAVAVPAPVVPAGLHPGAHGSRGPPLA